ncbi:MAG: hypothetical protein EOM77_03230 [Bacteroidia bacterium]|nr:hypothetical protein [Bacteroidia bacterium]
MMRIKIKSDGRKFVILLPNFLLRPSILWSFIKDKIDKDSQAYIRKMLPKACKELRRLKRRDKHFVLVDVTSADGDIVKITL